MVVESSQRKLNIFTINCPDSRETVSTIVIQNKGERNLVNIIQNVNVYGPPILFSLPRSIQFPWKEE